MRVPAWSTASLCAALLLCAACERKPVTPSQEAVAEPVVLSPSQELVLAGAKHWIARAKERAFSDAILRARSRVIREEEEGGPTIPASLAQSGERYTFVFSANNHGEREDCGCKRNPLGGLTRRATLIDMAGETATDEDAARYWKSKFERAGTLFVVDAGDALFKSTTLKSSPQSTRDQAMRHAEGVVDGLNLRPPDALNVGEYDLSLGVDVLEKLAKRAKFPFVSANLKRAGDKELLFPGHVIVERDGKKVAYVGLTKERARVNDYYKQQGVEVSSASEAYRREVKALPADVDVVVMLNNEGLPATQSLVRELRKDGVRVDVALVSNSNVNTDRPRWTEGVPVLEPMSRGKHIGRLDLWITGDEPPAYANDVPSKVTELDSYRRTWHGYLQTSYQLEKMRERVARQQVILELGEVPSDRKEGERKPLTDVQITERKAAARTALERAQSQIEPLEQRVALTSAEAMEAAALLDASAKPSGKGDDWAQVSVVPVLLEIPEEPATRKVLDAYKD